MWSPEALEDIEEAIDYLVEKSPPAAERLAAAIIALVERLATEPLEGTEHVLSDGERVHGWPLPPFRIYYQRRPDAFFVVRVYEVKRALKKKYRARFVSLTATAAAAQHMLGHGARARLTPT
jgi:plasmid stabilization system protein ParE